MKKIILQRRLAAGDPLPTEAELMDELGIGRNSVREALKVLEAVGIVDIRHGFGTFVGRMSLSGLVDELAFHTRLSLRVSLGHLIEVRELLESGLAGRLIDLGLAPLLSLEPLLEQMEAEARVGDILPETDRLFHEALYRPLGNPLVSQLLGAFWDVFFKLRDDLGTPDESPRDMVRKHRAIYEAVVGGDRAAASEAMRAHFDGVRGRLARLESLLDSDLEDIPRPT